MTLYQPATGDSAMGARAGGVFEPEIRGQEASLRRMVWSDSSRWEFQQFRVPAGLHELPFRRNRTP
jgi:hypothetical protein